MKSLKNFVLSVILVTACTITANAQKVANYFTGKPGTETYKGYAFWVKGNAPADIFFRSGVNRNEVKLTYAGKAQYQGKTCFKMVTADKRAFYVYPIGDKLAIVNPSTKKIETFNWEYEGPVDGIGTFCRECAQDEKAAMTLMKTSYLK